MSLDRWCLFPARGDATCAVVLGDATWTCAIAVWSSFTEGEVVVDKRKTSSAAMTSSRLASDSFNSIRGAYFNVLKGGVLDLTIRNDVKSTMAGSFEGVSLDTGELLFAPSPPVDARLFFFFLGIYVDMLLSKTKVRYSSVVALMLTLFLSVGGCGGSL